MITDGQSLFQHKAGTSPGQDGLPSGHSLSLPHSDWDSSDTSVDLMCTSLECGRKTQTPYIVAPARNQFFSLIIKK